MQKFLAVKMYKDVTQAPKGIPGNWPAEVRELGTQAEIPDSGLSPEWKIMTAEEYEAHRSALLPYYAEYERVYRPKSHRKPGAISRFFIKHFGKK